MKRFLKWRKMTWALLLWGTAIALWIVSGALATAIVVGAFGFIVLGFIWFMTIPLWRQIY
jgi:hypothetical protein